MNFPLGAPIGTPAFLIGASRRLNSLGGKPAPATAEAFEFFTFH